MLRYFHLENWKSFRFSATLDLVATREQRDGETLAHVHPPRARILPVAAIYGGNASGKTGLVEALGALQSIVLEDRGDRARLPVVPSHHNGARSATTLEVEFVVDHEPARAGRETRGALTEDRRRVDVTYRYTLVATPREIISESLVHVRAASERDVFFREDGNVELSRELREDPRTRAFAATLEANETLLRRLAMRHLAGASHVVNAFSWFQDRLRVVAPGAMAAHVPSRLHADDLYRQVMSKDLSEADTGISGIDFRDASISLAGLPQHELQEIDDSLTEEKGQWVVRSPEGRLMIFEHEDGKLTADEIVTRHLSDRGDFTLSLDQESDGTVRYFQLLPALHELIDSDASPVYVIDELDRSLHSALTAQLIRRFLDRTEADERAQLIFTTHDASLIRRDLLRRDELWFVEKERVEGGVGTSSELIRLSDLSHWGIRNSTDLFNMYLAGALPGAPELTY